jgi:catechol 2,3-dioxygenase-like lactoylglutathione lyase family enzyme
VDVQRICFLGTRTRNYEATAALFRDVLGLRSVHAEAGWSIFDLPSGRSDFVEVFGPDHENASVFPAEVREGIVVAFAVEDIAAAREELAAADVELLGGLVWADKLFGDPKLEGFGWFFFHAPDENVYVMQQDSRPDAA